MRKVESLNVMIDLRSRPEVLYAAERAGVRKLIWPLATTAILIVLVWAVVIELRLPPEQRAALFVVQSQIYP
jgi:hypothetical protein